MQAALFTVRAAGGQRLFGAGFANESQRKEKGLKPLFRLIAVAALAVLSLGTLSATANHEDPAVEHDFADPAFEARWERLDRPVQEFGVDRTFWWGPGPYTDGMMEQYAESPGGERLVQYFDKSRMEIIDPSGDPSELWYVTNGLLVVEMITGNMQVGHNEFIQREPANVPVAGDPDNQFGPTYATLAQRLDDAPLGEGELVTGRIERDGTVTEEPELAEYGIGFGTYVPETNHTVAAPFWEIMTTTGTIYAGGELTNGAIFQNPFYAVGFPITEAYWSTATVAGVDQDVLLQCFERRCLTYTPGNELGWQVEAGNVGQHYYRWRYGDGGEPGPGPEPEPGTAQIYLVAIGDNGENGQLIGCQDSLIPVEVEIEATDDPATRVERALNALFGVGENQDDLYNALYQSTLTVDSVTVEGDEVTVALSGDVLVGGTCDEPRVIEQIRATVLDAAGVGMATITVNGTPLDDIFGPGDDVSTADIYFVAIGDEGQNGIPIGVGDSLIPVPMEVEPATDPATMIQRALGLLLDYDSDTITDDEGRELFNALHNSDLQIVSVDVTDGLATVHLSGEIVVGGIGDEPRVIEQIRHTILGIEGIELANVFVDGVYLPGYFGEWDLTGGVLATFDVQGELFQLWTTNPDTIADILALEAGESEATIPNGPIHREPGEALHNYPWSWHLDPQQTEMAETAMEVCDGTPSQVENNLDEFVDNIGQYCPWNAELIHVEDLRPADGGEDGEMK